jgi:hypothetical protein
VKKDKMKKAVVLSGIFLISFLFSGCFTIPYSFSTYYEYYLYDNRGGSPRITGENLRTTLYFAYSSLFPPYASNKGGMYHPGISIFASENKFIKNVFINRVTVYTGKNEYSMLEKIEDVYIYQGRARGNVDDIEIDLFGDDLDGIRRTGLIDVGTIVNYVPDILNDENSFPYMNFIFISFQNIPVYYKYKEIKIHFDFSVELTTGEILTVNQEFVARRKLEFEPNYIYIFGTV